MKKITVNGVEYPCYPTMGAFLRFKTETGLDISEVKNMDTSTSFILLYCCLVSACKAEGKIFELSLMEFADSVSVEQMTEWTQVMNASEEDKGVEETKKKKQKNLSK